MNITKEQKEFEQSIINPELHDKLVDKEKITYNKNIVTNEYLKTSNKKQIYIIFEIVSKVLGYSFLFIDLTVGFLFVILGEVLRLINR